MTEELKPCPFCGHDDIAVDLIGGRTRAWCHESCYASVTDIDTDRAIETWNTRSPAWWDIESAPRDGDDPECLAWVDGIVEKVYWDGHGFVLDNEAWRGGPTQYVEPTHWMPLPLPPEEKA